MKKTKFIPGGSRPFVAKEQWVTEAIINGSKTQHRFPLIQSGSVIDGFLNVNTRMLWRSLNFDEAAVTCVSGPSGFEPVMSVLKKSGSRMHVVKPVFTQGSTLWVREPSWKDDDGKMHYKYAGDAPDTREGARFPFDTANRMREDDTRIILEITKVNTERLQEITDLEVSREGFEDKESFIQNWDKTWRGKRGMPNSWRENPWVHVVSFELMALR